MHRFQSPELNYDKSRKETFFSPLFNYYNSLLGRKCQAIIVGFSTQLPGLPKPLIRLVFKQIDCTLTGKGKPPDY